MLSQSPFAAGVRTLLACAAAAAVPVHAAVVEVDLHSGIDGLGHVLAAGSIDPFWTISTDGVNFSSARVAYPGTYPDFGSGQTCCGMETVDGTAAWVTTPSVVATSPTTGWGSGSAVYARRAIDLAGYDLASVSFNGKWRVADVATGIYVNGNLVPQSASGTYAFSSDWSFSLAAGSGYFVDGINTIELRGYSVNNMWDAFWISTTVTGDVVAVPEPQTYALMLAGLGLVGVAARRGSARAR
jgi:hypothetical protein